MYTLHTCRAHCVVSASLGVLWSGRLPLLSPRRRGVRGGAVVSRPVVGVPPAGGGFGGVGVSAGCVRVLGPASLLSPRPLGWRPSLRRLGGSPLLGSGWWSARGRGAAGCAPAPRVVGGVGWVSAWASSPWVGGLGFWFAGFAVAGGGRPPCPPASLWSGGPPPCWVARSSVVSPRGGSGCRRGSGGAGGPPARLRIFCMFRVLALRMCIRPRGLPSWSNAIIPLGIGDRGSGNDNWGLGIGDEIWGVVVQWFTCRAHCVVCTVHVQCRPGDQVSGLYVFGVNTDSQFPFSSGCRGFVSSAQFRAGTP